MIDMKSYGLDSYVEAGFKMYEGHCVEPARIIAEYKQNYKLITRYGDLNAEVSGKFRFNAEGTGDFPAVGDWVAAELRPNEGNATIHGVLPRKSKFSRKAAGNRTDEQIVAANFDYVFIVASLNYDLNLRRLERYLTTAWESGGLPVIILTKADLCSEKSELVQRIEEIAPGVPVHALSAVTGEGLDEIIKYAVSGKTIVLMGSSGVGKSTLLNKLAGRDIMYVNDIREDDSKGRHTTTHRQLAVLPSGCSVIDTPGMRELSVWDGDEGIETAFHDIDELAYFCKFTDCTHVNEPQCAVNRAIEEGRMNKARLESYRKLQKEIRFIEGKKDRKAALNQKDHAKSISKFTRSFNGRE